MIQKKIPCFNLKQIADSGQCFRMISYGDAYSVISGSHLLLVAQKDDIVSFFCREEEFSFWENYFDLQTDYQAFINAVAPDDTYLKAAAGYGKGIRILRQDPWEMIITFIISQQKTIPNIRALVEALSSRYGTRIEFSQELLHQYDSRTYAVPAIGLKDRPAGSLYSYTFPTPEQLARASLDDLLSLKLGYRAKYIKRVCEDACSGALDLPRLTAMDYPTAMEYLLQFYGIGEKVANCICLFGLHHIDAFPVDTWIKKILLREYAPKSRSSKNIPQARLCDALIQENFSQYKDFAGVMQQYIFYYERAVVSHHPAAHTTAENP